MSGHLSEHESDWEDIVERSATRLAERTHTEPFPFINLTDVELFRAFEITRDRMNLAGSLAPIIQDDVDVLMEFAARSIHRGEMSLSTATEDEQRAYKSWLIQKGYQNQGIEYNKGTILLIVCSLGFLAILSDSL